MRVKTWTFFSNISQRSTQATNSRYLRQDVFFFTKQFNCNHIICDSGGKNDHKLGIETSCLWFFHYFAFTQVIFFFSIFFSFGWVSVIKKLVIQPWNGLGKKNSFSWILKQRGKIQKNGNISSDEKLKLLDRP